MVTIVALDRLGNMLEEPFNHMFIVDTEPPTVDGFRYTLLSDLVDVIYERQPPITLPLYDPSPSSGIDPVSISLILDDNALDFEWDDYDNVVRYYFPEEDSLELGEHHIFFQEK